MNVLNATNTTTPLLEQHGMVNQSICVGEALVLPGGRTDVPDSEEATVRAHLKHLSDIGAVRFNEPEVEDRPKPPGPRNALKTKATPPMGERIPE